MDRRAHGAHSATIFSLSDTLSIKMIDLSGFTDEERSLKYPRGFHSNADGYINCEFAGNANSHAVILNVVNGVSYPYSIRQIYTTGTCIGTGSIIALR